MTNTTTKTAPERIWLQVDCDASISADGAIDGQDEPFSDDGVSWCSISVGGLEVEYIRADLVKDGAEEMKNAKFIEVSAAVRYWEDAFVNGKEDIGGSLMPCRNGDLWEPVIDLDNGQIQGWPDGVKADIHYKVCDQGEYWLLDASKNRVAKWKGDYVPNDYLCHGDNGYGDYIIFEVLENGQIEYWEKPVFDAERWQAEE